MILSLRKLFSSALLAGTLLPNAHAQTAASYCVSNLGGYGCDFGTVRIPGTSFNAYMGGYCQAGRNANGSQYNSYPVANGLTATLVPGTTYQLAARFGAARSAGLWLDANGNGTFEPGEWTQISTSTPSNGTEITVSFTVPAIARLGQTRLRLRTGVGLGANDACTTAGYAGDTRDFTVTLALAGSTAAAPYCAPSYQTNNPAPYNSLEEVLLAGTTLHSITGTPLTPYYSYPAVGDATGRVARGQRYNLYAYVTSSYYQPRVGAWVDWNQNQQFEASEYQAVTVGSSSGPSYYMTTLSVPSDAALGATRMRVRTREVATVITAADACTSFASGETEDYTITVDAAPTTPPLPTYNPVPAWTGARNDGGTSYDNMSDLAVDSTSGATYAVGNFQNSTRFGTLTATTGLGINGSYVTKYDASGTPLWVRSTDLNAASTYSSSNITAVAVDPQGNVYATGTLSGTARFGTGVSVTNSIYGGTFVVKYSATGTALWARGVTNGSGIGGSEFQLTDLAIDAQGNACLVGAVYYDGVATEAYVTKYSPAGTQLWQRTIGSTTYDRAASVAALPGGDFAVLVNYGLPFSIDGTAVAGNGMALLRLSPAGTLVWARTATGTVTGAEVCYDRRTRSLLVAGRAADDAVFDAATGISSQTDGAFVARYRPDGTLRWQRSASGFAYGLLPDGQGGAYVAGSYGQAGRFGGIPVSFPASSANGRMYVARYDSTGVARWVATPAFSTYSPASYTTGLGLLSDGTLLAGGSFSRQLQLNGFNLIENGSTSTSGSNSDAFLARMQPGCTVPVLATAAGTATVCAGDTLRLRAQGAPAGATFQWSGPNNFASSLPAPALPTATTALAGTYTLVLSAPAGCTSTTTLAVSVVAKPAQPTVQATRSGATTTFTSSATSGNQWYRNGILISGATAQTYVVNSAMQPGSYTVVVTNTGGCASPASVASVITATAQTLAATGLDLYPNPTPDGQVWLQRPRGAQATVLVIHNLLGETVRAIPLPASDGAALAVDLHKLPAGVYVLLLTGPDGLVARRLVVE